MSNRAKINTKNLRRLCGLNGLRVRDLANRLGVSDTLLYRAVKEPESYPARFAQIEAALSIREIHQTTSGQR